MAWKASSASFESGRPRLQMLHTNDPCRATRSAKCLVILIGDEARQQICVADVPLALSAGELADDFS